MYDDVNICRYFGTTACTLINDIYLFYKQNVYSGSISISSSARSCSCSLCGRTRIADHSYLATTWRLHDRKNFESVSFPKHS